MRITLYAARDDATGETCLHLKEPAYDGYVGFWKCDGECCEEDEYSNFILPRHFGLAPGAGPKELALTDEEV